jgi:hypothetical protein
LAGTSVTISNSNPDAGTSPDAGYYAPVTVQIVSEVPEPMTLGLLGLGGLFLRRRMA